MRRLASLTRALGLLTVLTWALVTPPAAGAQAGGDGQVQPHLTQVDSSHFPQVTVYVSATDSRGQPVGVDASRLRLEENGQPITPEEIQSVGPVQGITTMLVFDISGSMNKAGKLESAKNAARAFIERMRPEDRTGLMAFDTEVHLAQPPTSDQAALLAAVDGLYGVHDTALYDALAAAEDQLSAVTGRKAIIALTDGMDNHSQATLQDVVAGVGDQSMTISAVGLGDPSQPAGAWSGIDVAALKRIAQGGGGEFALAEDQVALIGLFERYSQLLQTEVAVTYVSPSRLKDGLTRRISVSLGGEAAPTGAAVYNPGGLLPEVAHPVAWPLFGLAILALVGLLFVPGVVGWLRRSPGSRSPGPASGSRIRLH